mgnify:CR=1 FL=1
MISCVSTVFLNSSPPPERLQHPVAQGRCHRSFGRSVHTLFIFGVSDASPELLCWFTEQILWPGPAVSLKCVATDNPPPQFVWTLDGFLVLDNTRYEQGKISQ